MWPIKALLFGVADIMYEQGFMMPIAATHKATMVLSKALKREHATPTNITDGNCSSNTNEDGMMYSAIAGFSSAVS